MNPIALTSARAAARRLLAFAVLLLPAGLPSQNAGVDWTRFVGGQAGEDCGQRNALWVTSTGDSFVAGSTSSPNFPTTVASTPAGGADVCVARITPDGTQLLLGMTFGGSDAERANAIAFDEATGRLYLAGRTRSADFPVTPNAHKAVLDGAQDGFLTIVDTASGALVYSTFVGGGGGENLFDLHVDTSGTVTLVGYTNSVGIATPNAYDPIHNGVFDGLIAQIDPAIGGASGLTYLTYVGGADQDFLLGARLHVDAQGVLTVCSASASLDFPVTSGAWSTTNQGGPAATPWDAVVFRFDPSLPGAGPLVWSTFFGGAGYENAQAVSVDPRSGLVTVGGTTASAIAFPGNPVQPALAGGADAFVARFDPSQNGTAQLVWGTYLGGSTGDTVNAICVDSAGNVVIGGQTGSGNFPTTPGAAQTTLSTNGADGFIARLDAARGRLLYSSLVGGPDGVTDLVCLAPGPRGDVYAAGWTIATALPQAIPNTRGDAADLFIGRFNLLPDGVERYGTDSANCGGPIFGGVREQPVVGRPGFSLMCTGIPAAATPPYGLGAVLFAAAPVPRGNRLGAPFDVTLFVGLPALAAAPMTVDARGFAEIPLPLTGVPQGVTAFAQFSWLNPTTCGSASLLSTSNALRITTR